MRAVVQRVVRGSVAVEGRKVCEIGPGLVVLLAVGHGDTAEDAGYLADKIANLRIFEDNQGKMNLSVLDTGGSLLVVSQFTLYGDCRKGRRPSFTEAALPENAVSLYNKFVQNLEALGPRVETGHFREQMLVEILNDGPVTMLLDSKKGF
ncbi:MAG: D-aminoacyl-tRNA deacylase [Pelotomaculaceae bacterium]|uniref:Gly-tRNA(Ala) deacylase / D-Tyr-tRNATyr deacylase n=1 Tax=anaerobic digester metagenome TaxID=1263854 RepID=A0A485M6W8_9ZZZZ|nr:D-aminoacyl-tRNA deacylase [Bacillota bacterium]HHU86598.1 D-tyrosyl-tRNA(Tyr) deacylase [Peptococcaceae bacterium]